MVAWLLHSLTVEGLGGVMGFSLTKLKLSLSLLGMGSLLMGGCAGTPQFEEVPNYATNADGSGNDEESSDPEGHPAGDNSDLIPGLEPIRGTTPSSPVPVDPAPAPAPAPAPVQEPPSVSTPVQDPAPAPAGTPETSPIVTPVPVPVPVPATNPAPIPVPSSTCRESVFEGQITPASTRGANIIFLIDDSGSMDGEIAKVVAQIQLFINAISAATSSNYRIVLIFNTNVDAPRKLSPGQNPFAKQLENPHVKYIEQRTWSKWADIALFRAFAPTSFRQLLPQTMPIDRPFVGTSMQRSQCYGPGKYFRPRDAQLNFFNTPGCIDAVPGAMPIESFLLPNIAVNIIALSDDDLNVAFDRAKFSKDDPTKNAYPEIPYLMMKNLLAPLGAKTPFAYHSVVGTQLQELGVELVGNAHMALSKRTQGSIHSITLKDYQPIFEALQNSIIFSEKSIMLTCSVRPQMPVGVTLNGMPLDTTHFDASVGDPVIRFKPSAFEGLDPDSPVMVQVRY